MSLQSLLSIARSALLAHEAAMNVTAHNVANANTPGYSRQRLDLTAATPASGALFPLGRGVDAVAIERSRDSFFDSSFRQDTGLLGRSGTLHDYLSQIEGSMNEPSSNGVAASLDSLFSALSDLSNDPANHTNRTVVIAAANRLTGQLHALDGQLSSVTQEAASSMRLQVTSLNTALASIAELNQRIQATGGPTHTAPDLMDQRDVLIDQLSSSLGVRVLDRGDGTVAVLAGDTTLVDGSTATSLSVVAVGAGWGIAAGGGAAFDPGSGSLKALTDLTQTRIPALRGQLDQLAGALVNQFNALHRTGSTLSGATNVDFFDPAGVTAGTISLSAVVLASPDNIAASATGAQGNGGIAAQLAALSGTGIAALGGQTFREDYVGIASGLGLDVRNADQDSTVNQTMLDRSTQGREAASGVSVDEEMVNLIGEQQAYQAAARIVSVADQMIQSVLNIT